MTCEKHKTCQEAFGMSPEELAHTLADMHYGSLTEVFAAFARRVLADAKADTARGRGELAEALDRTAAALTLAYEYCGDAWRISAPHMSESAKGA